MKTGTSSNNRKLVIDILPDSIAPKPKIIEKMTHIIHTEPKANGDNPHGSLQSKNNFFIYMLPACFGLSFNRSTCEALNVSPPL